MAAHDFTVLMVLAPLMSELLATAPGVDLRTLAANAETVVDDLDRGNLDLALGAFGAMPQRFVGVARREHPRLENGRMSLEAFVDLPHDEIVSRKGRAIAVQGDVSKAEHVRWLTSRAASSSIIPTPLHRRCRTPQAGLANSPGSSVSVRTSKSGAPGKRSRRWP